MSIRKPLSGWTRLWVVFAVLTWLFGAWFTLTTAGRKPPSDDRREAVCAYVNLEAGLYEEEFYQRCLRSDEIYQAYLSRTEADRERYQVALLAGAVSFFLLPFLFGLAFAGIAGVVKWVWRGFRPSA